MKPLPEELKKVFANLQGRKIITGNQIAATKITADHSGNVFVQSFEDVTEILQRNAYLRGVPKEQKTKDGMRMTASIPSTLYHDLKKQGIMSDQKRFRAWLNHPDNAKWRTTEGKL